MHTQSLPGCKQNTNTSASAAEKNPEIKLQQVCCSALRLLHCPETWHSWHQSEEHIWMELQWPVHNSGQLEEAKLPLFCFLLSRMQSKKPNLPQGWSCNTVDPWPMETSSTSQQKPNVKSSRESWTPLFMRENSLTSLLNSPMICFILSARGTSMVGAGWLGKLEKIDAATDRTQCFLCFQTPSSLGKSLYPCYHHKFSANNAIKEWWSRWKS